MGGGAWAAGPLGLAAGLALNTVLNVPQALGEMKTLPSVNGGSPIDRHGMDQVIDGIEAQKKEDINTLTPSTQTQLDPKDDLNKTRYCSEGNPQSHQDMVQLLKAQENEDINTPYSEKPLTEPNQNRRMGRNNRNKRKN
ncbi:MAG: hypothetical protein L3J00_01785 [Thiomicrorhabdus sp.]|nr:hypothetical protein [Thiomicrorhabdus sp.]